MKPITFLYLWFSVVDLITTYLALNVFGLVETNSIINLVGWSFGITERICWTWGICMFYELRPIRWYSLVPLLVMIYAVGYNTHNILYVMSR